MEEKQGVDLLIFGAGGHAKVVSECAGLTYPNQIMLSGDGVSGQWRNIPIIPQERKTLAEWKTLCPRAFVAVGNTAKRKSIVTELEAAGFTIVVLIHPSAAVSSSAYLEPGVLICPQAVVNADARIGKGCIINTGAIVEHECMIGAYSHISPRAVLGGGVVVGECCWICLGASVSDHLSIGGYTTVGAGAVVLSSLEENVLAAGVPARMIKRCPAECM